jgi:hypothetical protein
MIFLVVYIRGSLFCILVLILDEAPRAVNSGATIECITLPSPCFVFKSTVLFYFFTYWVQCVANVSEIEFLLWHYCVCLEEKQGFWASA